MNIRQDFIDLNPYSRPGIKKVVIHWTQSPKQSANATRNYFDGHKNDHIYGSAQYIVDPTEIVQTMPENEIAYHCGATTEFPYTSNKWKWFGAENPNYWTIGIEMEPTDSEGRFDDQTIMYTAELTADICKRYNLDPLVDVVRHGDITVKDCPRWYINHPDEWDVFKLLVKHFMDIGG